MHEIKAELEELEKFIKDGLDKMDLNGKKKEVEVKAGEGIGAIEAPRGGLYNEIHFDDKGIIKYANIITPTVQNLTSIEKSAEALLQKYGSMDQKEKEHLLEMLVRAYDPCITCSVH